MSEMRKTLRKLGEDIASQQDFQMALELSKITLERPDIKRFLSERCVLKLTIINKGNSVMNNKDSFTLSWGISYCYRLKYHSPSLWTRIKFFIFDMVLYLKELSK